MPALRELVDETTQEALDAAVSSGVMVRAARQARRMIRRRTRRGIDRFGRQFAPYAPSTAKKKGRFSPVTLRETGQMLESLSIREGTDSAVPAPSGRGSTLRSASTGRFVSATEASFRASVNLKGSRNRRIGRYHMFGTRKMPARKWFGLTPRQEQRVAQEIGSGLREAIRRSVPEDRRRRVQIKLFG